MSDLLAILKASAEELLRTDLLHMTTKEQNIHKEYLLDSYVLIHYRTGLPPTRLHTNWKGPMRVIKGLNSRYTLLDFITGKEKDYHCSATHPSRTTIPRIRIFGFVVREGCAALQW